MGHIVPNMGIEIIRRPKMGIRGSDSLSDALFSKV